MHRGAAIRVWRTGRPEPAEGTPHDFTPELVEKNRIPPHWFQEDPGYAAELYALEIGIPPGHVGDHWIRVSVRGTDGSLTFWKVRLYRTIGSSVHPDD